MSCNCNTHSCQTVSTLAIAFSAVDDKLIPTKAHESDAGYDLFSNDEDFELYPGARKVVKTGVVIELPEQYEAQIRPRSGNAAKLGITVLNSPGTVDCFTLDSLIKTISGDKSIKELNINDIVLSVNFDNNMEIEKDTIKAIVDTGIQEVIVITTAEDKQLKVTKNTLVCTKNGFKKASELTEEDELLTF